jgi:broad specificity phosphatase PhoE
MKTSTILNYLTLTSLASARATVYLIRHGEKPDSGDGLNAQGKQRAECLRNVFGASSGYDIGHVMAQTPQSSRSA